MDAKQFRQIVKEEINDALDPVKKDLGTMRQDLDTVKEDLDTVKEDLDTVKEDLDVAREDLNKLNKKADGILEYLENVKDDVFDHEKRLKRIENVPAVAHSLK